MVENDVTVLSRDGRRKAVLSAQGDDLIVEYYRIKVSGCGEPDDWRFEHEAVVKVRPVEAALVMIEKILNG